MKHVHNLERWYKVPQGQPIVFPGEAMRTVELRIVAVGPCVAYVYESGPKGGVEGERMLLGYVEGGEETFRWSLAGTFSVILDAAEAWVYRDQSPLAVPVDDPVSYVRFEKAGLYVDELGIALHRQAVLSRLAGKQQREQETAYTRDLEARLMRLDAQIAALTPAASAPPPADA